ncbi:MAG: hypothetical protein ACKOTH_11155, partial [Solirubrobacterales bacterium]
MAVAGSVLEGEAGGLPALTLVSPEELEATFVPGAGMVGCSRRDRGEALLGQRGGLAAWREKSSTFGIPLLYPWANRLGASRYEAAGRVELGDRVAAGHLDADPAHPVAYR